MILPIAIYGHPVLRKVAKEIDEDYPNLKEFIDNMFATMYHTDGIGLAAPQVGKSIRLFVIDATPMAEDFPELSDLKKTFINAEITEYEGETVTEEEGCISVPAIREKVTRETRIRIQYVDENFEEHDEVYEGWAARVIQHEYDHLEGTLFVDKISPLRRRLISGKLQGLAKGKIKPRYKTIKM